MPFDLLSAVGGVAKWAGTKLAEVQLTRRKKRVELRREIQAITFQLRMNRDVRSYTPLLVQLRNLFAAHPELMQDPDNCAFYSEWLRQPFIEFGISPGGEQWPRTRIEKLHRDLRDLHV
jgi:hypothetical protein